MISNISKSNIKIYFKGTVPLQYKQEKTDDIPKLSKKVLARLSERTEKNVPDKGEFKRLAQLFMIPESQYKATLAVESDLTSPINERNLVLSAQDAYGSTVDCIILRGNKSEVLKYLNDEKSVSDLSGAIKDIKESLDKKVTFYY